MFGWLVHFDEDEAVFRKPIIDRVFYGVVGVGVTYIFISYIFPWYKGSPADQEMFMFTLPYFVSIFLVLCFFAGPKEIKFDFQLKRYQYRLGFAFLSWTRSGDFGEISHFGIWNLTKFTGLSIEWKETKRLQTTFVECSTGQEARLLAEKLGNRMGVPAEAGVVLGLRKLGK